MYASYRIVSSEWCKKIFIVRYEKNHHHRCVRLPCLAIPTVWKMVTNEDGRETERQSGREKGKSEHSTAHPFKLNQIKGE